MTQLALIRQGGLLEDIDEALRELNRCVGFIGKSGTLTIKISVKPATMGTAAIHALKNVTDNEKEGKPRCQAHVAALLAPLEHAISVYFTMMRELYRSEHEAARRQADNLSLTKALQDVAVGGIALVAPDETDNELSRCGIRGVAYVHDRCEPGYMVREDGQNFWVIPERETFVRMTEPTLMFFLDTEPSYANTVRIQNQDRAA